jgi:transcriptional regulator
MYTPPLFREQDRAELHQLIFEARLTVLVSNGPDGLPEISYLPLLFDPDDGPHGVLHGHFARANPHWQTLSARPDATAIFMGPDAYVSPTWYPTKQVHHKHVPTWNYETVHAIGQAEIFDDSSRLRELVARLTSRHEDGRTEPWTLDQAPADFIEAQLKAIIGMRFVVTELRGKRKLSQNRVPEDREGVREALAASADPVDQAVAASMTRLQQKMPRRVD